MAVTNYYTVNGQIIGEGTAAGGYRPYGHDALGSVVATYDSTGSLQNTYRNAPYGTQVEKTGTAPDPRFLWNGGSGYRDTSRSFSPYYVRDRHLDNASAQWTTVDTLWPDQPPYAYVHANPALNVDPSGKKATESACLAPACIKTCNFSGGNLVEYKFWTKPIWAKNAVVIKGACTVVSQSGGSVGISAGPIQFSVDLNCLFPKGGPDIIGCRYMDISPAGWNVHISTFRQTMVRGMQECCYVSQTTESCSGKAIQALLVVTNGPDIVTWYYYSRKGGCSGQQGASS